MPYPRAPYALSVAPGCVSHEKLVRRGESRVPYQSDAFHRKETTPTEKRTAVARGTVRSTTLVMA
ncbi:hypothetical protein OsI_16731 [Oryza sativa Indica Group]|nr:hypothetical protein OsI_16731 [Oryza sativa Indica Group]EEE61379.1 hypothetical protein OsJ_15546 [Oryza sativa Japonica Group]